MVEQGEFLQERKEKDMVGNVNGVLGVLKLPLGAFCWMARGGGGRLRQATVREEKEEEKKQEKKIREENI